MDKKELENLLMRFSHLGVSHSKNGALMIGKAPHIAEFAWLNVVPLYYRSRSMRFGEETGMRYS